MFKLILVLILAFGAVCALLAFAPSSASTAFHLSGHAVPWFLLGGLLFAYIGYKKIAS